MVRITEELLRKRAEHNEGRLSTLREVALHQYEIERIEVLGETCKLLEIVLLQNNLITRIENVHQLKSLKYLNLAVNHITRIENLEWCESLQKLDLTANAVDDLLCVESLRGNYNLEDLYLVGNPCTHLDGYRDFIISVLPQLKRLDGTEISRSERILARQRLPSIRERLERERATHETTRIEEGKRERGEGVQEEKETQEEKEKEKEEESADTTPEHDAISKDREEGRIRQKNEGRWAFRLEEEDGEGNLVLDVPCGKYLDTSAINVDLHPTWVRITIKGRVLQLVLPDEVRVEASVIQRSTTTGHLVLKMPKLGGVIPFLKPRPQKVDRSPSSEKNVLVHDLQPPALTPVAVIDQVHDHTDADSASSVADEADVPPLE